ncbi:MAG: tRNA preQ1(34) S-adenosylmethionine ribosyltransferase-isomerase QueA [Alphaproteobacteria bacterium]|nr:tRNA preQ1(34) S-adenosylmethionine ribosyltransferase-isomerase QueA [Alphaproteobacteria bacterium]
MKVDIFDFELNKDLIAKQPAEPRDSCRLLDMSEENCIKDRIFTELPDLLEEGDVIVLNDTKVIPARLYGAKRKALVEVTLYRPEDGLSWHAFIKNAKRLHIGDTINFYTNEITPEQSSFQAIVLEKNGEEGVLIRFQTTPEQLADKLEQYGSMPLPPYIKRDKPQNSIWNKYNDKENYQTVYAKHEGAVAAPTAGLHFTPNVFEALEKKGVKKVFLTLHVGAGTFLPVKVDDTKDHKMHTEYGIITQETCNIINKAKANGNRIIAVGTTSLRLLESAGDKNGTLHPFSGDTGIFITPGYKFKIIDYLITNFHLPKSTLFMLVCAVAGIETMKAGYRHAMEQNYHFYSYGDSSILKCINKI